MSRSLTVVGLLVLAGLARAQEWPQFRGPGGSARTVAIPLSNGATLEDANWRVELPGTGHSSPVLWGEKLFLACLSDSGTVRIVQCHSTEDGSVLWKHEVPFSAYESHRLNDFASSSPATDSERVYFAWPDGQELTALALGHDGQVIWTRELGPYRAKHGGGSSPLVVEGVLVIANDNESEQSFLVGLDAETGAELWRRERRTSKASFATPVQLEEEDGTTSVVFASTSHGLTALDPESGEPRWEIEELFEQRCVASPVVADGLVLAFAGRGGGGSESAAVLPLSKGPRVSYRLRRSLPYVPTPVAVGELLFLFADGGIVSCVVPATGDVVWSERVDGEFFGSPVCAGDRLFAMTKGGELVILSASETFELLGRVDLGEPSFSTPAIAGGVLYLRTAKHLISFGSEDT